MKVKVLEARSATFEIVTSSLIRGVTVFILAENLRERKTFWDGIETKYPRDVELEVLVRLRLFCWIVMIFGRCGSIILWFNKWQQVPERNSIIYGGPTAARG